MDSLPEDEIEAIWQRQKKYIDISQIRSIDKKMVQEEIENIMRNANVPSNRETNPQAMQNYLIDRGFPQVAAENRMILKEIAKNRISEIKIKGQTRYTIKKTTSSFTSKSGKSIRAGQFLSGKTIDEALKDLLQKKGGIE